ncbi:ATP-binding protein [Fructilactobacillus cliffordii]|uniref:AAA family ATPase n=1 Tax=Fructilactobacillus cliffordii TaxID=2940299 RepID=UPI00209243F3|nr:AAA family ATPase [Fructilactobacillus cliffordii]USS86946.1 ATP-binding protein [Fructilactobacillus cliffordii]
MILDEPEINLHPKWQIIFAEIIVLIQKEFKMHVICTTHSPYFLQALQVYSEYYDIDKKTRYYLSSIEDEKTFINDVTESIDEIYKLMAKPFDVLNKIQNDIDQKNEENY